MCNYKIFFIYEHSAGSYIHIFHKCNSYISLVYVSILCEKNLKESTYSRTNMRGKFHFDGKIFMLYNFFMIHRGSKSVQKAAVRLWEDWDPAV